MCRYLELTGMKIMGIHPVDVSAFPDLLLKQLFEFQSLLDFLTPRYKKFYPLAVCEFYANLIMIDDEDKSAIRFKTMVHGQGILFDEVIIFKLLGWSYHSIPHCSEGVDFSSGTTFEDITRIRVNHDISQARITSFLMKGGKLNIKKDTLYAFQLKELPCSLSVDYL